MEGHKNDAHHFRFCTTCGPPHAFFSDSWKTGAQEKPGNCAILYTAQTPSIWDPKWLWAESSDWLSPKINSLEVLWIVVAVVQLLSHVWLFVIPWTAACQDSMFSTVSWSLFKFMCIESMMVSNDPIFCCPLLLLPSIYSSSRVFSNEWVLYIRWPKYWSFSFSMSPSNEYSGLISFRIDYLISLLSKGLSRVFSSTTIQKHQFFSTQPIYGPTLPSVRDYWKNHSLDYRDFVSKLTSLHLNTLSRFVITFLPGSKHF